MLRSRREGRVEPEGPEEPEAEGLEAQKLTGVLQKLRGVLQILR